MAVSRVDRINKNFRAHFEQVKIYKDIKTDKEYAKLLGCCERTVVSMRSDPFSVQARWVLLVEDYWQECKRKYSYD